MKRQEAIQIICNQLTKNDLVLSSTGNISRELYITRDSLQNFYMLGSMGLASSIGLGLAINFFGHRVIVIEGDGSILMNMGSLATVGHLSPKNLIHIVLDNESYESTGGHPSVSKTTNLEKVAWEAGYKKTWKITTKKELEKSVKESSFNGPSFILVKVEGGRMLEKLPRVPYNPKKVKKRFEKFIKTIR